MEAVERTSRRFYRELPASLLPMSDEHWSPFAPQLPRHATPAEVLWVLTKPPHTRRLELRDFGHVGAELQMYVDDEFASGRHYEARALALADAGAHRELLLSQGWADETTKGGT